MTDGRISRASRLLAAWGGFLANCTVTAAVVAPAELPRGTMYAVTWDTIDSQVFATSFPDGDFQLVGSTGVAQLNALARTADHRLIAAGRHTHLVEIDPATGRATDLVPLVLPGEFEPISIASLAVSPSGEIYLWQSPQNGLAARSLWRMNIRGGAAVEVARYPDNGPIYLLQGLSFGPGGRLWGLDNFRDLVEIDPVTGLIEDVADPFEFGGQALEFAGEIPIAGGRLGLRSFDLTTGEVRQVGSAANFELRGLAFVPIPEPTSMTLASLGVLGACRRRRSWP